MLRDRSGSRMRPSPSPTARRQLGFAGPAAGDAARQAGVLCSLTTEPLRVEPGSDPYAWGRFNVSALDTAATLAAKIDGRYNAMRGRWRPG